MSITRRKFIQNIGAGASLAVLPFSDLIASSFQEKKLGVALVGLGYYSEFQLAPALLQTRNCYLAGIVTGTPEKAVKWKAKYNIPDSNIYNYQNFDQIVNNKDIDVVYVVLPNSMHHEFVVRAAKAGKHVITEKPMGVSVKECEDMIAVCKKANVKLSVGYRLNYEPFNKEVARIAREKEFGKIKLLEASFGFISGDPTQWRLKKSLAGGGALMDVGIYALHAARFVTGEEPLYVTAREYKTDPVKFKEVDETIVWQLQFPSGVICNSTTSYNASVERFYMSAENGWVELGPAYGYGPLQGRTHKGELKLPIIYHQVAQLEGMAGSILAGQESIAPGEEGLKDMKVIEAIYRSIATGKKVKIA
jgi:predicted dehydrogenase